MLTAERIRELFAYDPETGLFTRRVTVANCLAGTVIRGCKQNFGYRLIRVDNRLYVAHRLAWLHYYGEFPPKGMDLDHINRVRDDNRIANLRLATRSQNTSNRKRQANSSTGVTGITWCKRSRRWIAQLHLNRRHIHLGAFRDFADAVAARQRGEIQHFGEFRRTEPCAPPQ